jgi:hypothetical protein
VTNARLHVRRAAVWASIAFQRARRGEPSGVVAQRALAELLAVHTDDLGEDRRAEYLEAVVRVGAVRWAAATPSAAPGPLTVSTTSGDPGQTCVELRPAHGPRDAPLVRRCTYGIVWSASAQSIAQGRALVLAVQPLESWRELWVFHEDGGAWTLDVLSPGAEDPQVGYGVRWFRAWHETSPDRARTAARAIRRPSKSSVSMVSRWCARRAHRVAPRPWPLADELEATRSLCTESEPLHGAAVAPARARPE